MRTIGLLALALFVGCGSGGSDPEDDPDVFATEHVAYFTHDAALGTGGDGQTYYPAFIEYQRWDAATGDYFESWIVFQNGVRVTDQPTVRRIIGQWDPFAWNWYAYPGFEVEGWWWDYVAEERIWVGPGVP